MSRAIGNRLPDDLYDRLRGEDVGRHAGKAILICTVDAEGRPHLAMLSYLEVVAKDRGNIRLATYSGSSTTANVRRDGRLTMVVVDERMAYYVKGTARELRGHMECAPDNAKLNLAVEQVLADEADVQMEADAYVSGGITYHDPNLATAQMKARQVLKELLES